MLGSYLMIIKKKKSISNKSNLLFALYADSGMHSWSALELPVLKEWVMDDHSCII